MITPAIVMTIKKLTIASNNETPLGNDVNRLIAPTYVQTAIAKIMPANIRINNSLRLQIKRSVVTKANKKKD